MRTRPTAPARQVTLRGSQKRSKALQHSDTASQALTDLTVIPVGPSWRKWIVTASFVHWYEEPTLVRTYGEQYEEYRRNVPAWTPRLTPWTPSETD